MQTRRLKPWLGAEWLDGWMAEWMDMKWIIDERKLKRYIRRRKKSVVICEEGNEGKKILDVEVALSYWFILDQRYIQLYIPIFFFLLWGIN